MREIIRQKIVDSLAVAPSRLTRRDVRLPQVAGKAMAVIGLRRAGKTTFLWQIVAERLATETPREWMVYFNFEDERLAGVTAQDLAMIVEEYYRLHPEVRDRQRAVFRCVPTSICRRPVSERHGGCWRLRANIPKHRCT